MTITLTDIPAAVTDYLRDDVTMTVTNVRPVDPDQDVLTPGQTGTWSVHATNAGTGVRLLDVTFHAKSSDETLLTLVAPGDAIRTTDGKGHVVKPGDTAGELFCTYTDENLTILEPGDGLELVLTVKCLDQAAVDLTCHVHADVDQAALFPRGTNTNGKTTVKIV